MQIHNANAYREASELEIIEQYLPIEGGEILELGCGRAWMTRQIAQRFHPAHVVATEVDRIQHEKNLQIDDLPNVTFVYGGAEQIDLPDSSIDIAIMLKSLHHVPRELMDQGLSEVARILKPGGLAYISKPVYQGAFNDILKLFNDEKEVRKLAFSAVRRAVQNGSLELVEQIFFNSPGHYADFAEFEARMLNVTHTEHRIDEPLYRQIKAAFEAHMTPGGADFLKPSRVDLLRKPHQ
ncbi:class I SAM-dependent methyltransferase [Solemya velesiana gill symbiont]|uniref:SAM-dependent methyltransferase n=1 Tax=Solemya velesiana gill symbiont TaxID=1918948 RepID=A0A1T2KXS2_9GAMM|nr:class I SAM-dependent methyltransferase [Solemya velesiana gill symbiont]OOZ37604.1 SAM-dependent methyltransferase [Solemya velesiana gill symbiont]